MTKPIKLEFKVTLTVDAPSGFGENIKDAAAVRREYAKNIGDALDYYNDLIGLTPDWCNEKDLGVKDFEVAQL